MARESDGPDNEAQPATDPTLQGSNVNMFRVKADLDKCIGAGTCVRVASAVFSQDDDSGLVVVLDDAPDDAQRGAVENAVRLCPTHALHIEP